jgi:hypothetical protein
MDRISAIIVMNANQIAHIHAECKKPSRVRAEAKQAALQHKKASAVKWNMVLTAAAKQLHPVCIKSKATMFL